MAKDHIARIIADTKQFDAKITASMRVLQSFNQYIQEVGAGNVNFSRTEQDVIKGLGKLEVSATTTEGAVKQLDMMFRELTNTYRKLDSATKASDVGQSMARSIDSLRDRLKVAQADLKAMGGDAAVAGGKGKGMFSGILGGNLAARAVMDSLRFLKDTVKDAVEANMEFEYSQATLAAVLGKSKEEIMDLTIQAKKLGSTSLYSAKEISELQVVLARLGFNKTEIEDSTDAIAKLALATGVSLEHAASLTGATLRAFGYDTKEAARVASVLGVSTTKSALDMEKLRTAMSYASSVARQAGFEIEDVVAMLGKMVDNGQQATTAGVNMRNIMLDLSNKSSKLSRAIKEVTGKEQVRNFDEFVEALRQLRDAGINLDDVANVVQKRVTPGFLNMIANTDGITKLRDELKGCTGELDVMAEKMEDTLSGAAKKAGNAWNGLMLSFANSNGILKDTVTLWTELINKITKARNLSQGGDIALATMAPNSSELERLYQDKIKGYGKKTNEEILVDANREKLQKTGYYTTARSLLDRYDKLNKNYKGGYDYNYSSGMAALDKELKDLFPKLNNFVQLRDYVSGLSTDMDVLDRIIAKYKPFDPNDNGGTSDSIREGAGLGLGDKLSNEMTDAQRAEKRVEDALNAYEIAITKAALEKEAGYINEEEYTKKRLRAEETLYGVYADLAAEFGDEDWKKNMHNEAIRVRELAESAENLRRAREAAAEAEREEARKLREQKGLDSRILRGLQSEAKRAGVSYESVGLTGMKEKIDNETLGNAISEDTWNDVADRLNEVLGKQKYYIAIDFETGSIQKIQKEIFSLGDAVGALQSLSSGFQSLKTSTQDLAETLQGDADGFDKMFAVIDYGLGILQTFVSIQKAIDVLSKMAIVTKQAETAATIEDTGAALANAAAKGAEASAAGAAAAAEGGKAVSWLPIVGPMLAVAAIAAIAAAISSAFSKTEYHAGGGMVGMNGMRPLGTDVTPCMLTPGEIVLNRAQQSNIANQLQGAGMRTQTIIVKGEVSGRALRMVMDNDNRASGGTRGLYARTH